MPGGKQQGKVQIYTGCGKGKSTAAFGLAMRAAGCGGKVFIIQFQKARLCGEHKSAEKLGIGIAQCPQGRGSGPCAAPCPLMTTACGMLRDGGADLLILDEIMAAMRYGCITLQESLSLLDTRSEKTELVLTGRGAPAALIERADLVTEMKKIKHYYDAGLLARRGIEY